MHLVKVYVRVKVKNLCLEKSSTLSVKVIKVKYRATTFSKNKSHLVDVSPVLAQQPEVLVAIGKPNLHELAHRLPLGTLRSFWSKS